MYLGPLMIWATSNQSKPIHTKGHASLLNQGWEDLYEIIALLVASPELQMVLVFENCERSNTY